MLLSTLTSSILETIESDSVIELAQTLDLEVSICVLVSLLISIVSALRLIHSCLELFKICLTLGCRWGVLLLCLTLGL